MAQFLMGLENKPRLVSNLVNNLGAPPGYKIINNLTTVLYKK